MSIGGRWDAQNKILPGAYINVEADTGASTGSAVVGSTVQGNEIPAGQEESMSWLEEEYIVLLFATLFKRSGRM